MKHAKVISQELPFNVDAIYSQDSEGQLIIRVNPNTKMTKKEILTNIRIKRLKGEEQMVAVFEVNQTLTQTINQIVNITVDYPINQTVNQTVNQIGRPTEQPEEKEEDQGCYVVEK